MVQSLIGYLNAIINAILAGISSFALVHGGLQTKNDVEIDEPDHICYPIVGCFDNEYPFDCLGTRNLPCKSNLNWKVKITQETQNAKLIVSDSL